MIGKIQKPATHNYRQSRTNLNSWQVVQGARRVVGHGPLKTTCLLHAWVGNDNPNQKQDGTVDGSKSLEVKAHARSNEEGIPIPSLEQNLGTCASAIQQNCGQW